MNFNKSILFYQIIMLQGITRRIFIYVTLKGMKSIETALGHFEGIIDLMKFTQLIKE